MSRGRCSGCGQEDVSSKKIRAHTMDCPQYVALYKKNPAWALDPEAEYLRHKASAEDAQVTSDARDVRQARYAQINADKLKAADERWKEVGPRSMQSIPPAVALSEVDGGRVTDSGTTASQVARMYGEEAE